MASLKLRLNNDREHTRFLVSAFDDDGEKVVSGTMVDSADQLGWMMLFALMQLGIVRSRDGRYEFWFDKFDKRGQIEMKIEWDSE